MLRVKNCHQGLRPRSRLLGLQVLDLLLLFPPLFVCSVLLGRPLLGAALAVGLGLMLRLLEWGRLPGHTTALLQFLVYHPFSPALGSDRSPPYPHR